MQINGGICPESGVRSALNPLTPESIVRQHPEQVAAELEGEVLMMNINTGNYYGLNEVASFIWRQLARPLPVHMVCDAVQGEFDVPPDTCEADALSFLEGMLKDGMLQLVESWPSDLATQP